jgi:hypothetical protein
MSLFSNYLLVILIALIILLTVTYTTDYVNIPSQIYNFFSNNNSVNIPSSSDNVNPEKKDINNEDMNYFLIDTNFASVESDNVNKELFNPMEEFQMTETTGNAIADALKDALKNVIN